MTYFLDFCKNTTFLVTVGNELNIEISQTFNQIKRADQMIKFQQNQDDFNELNVYQYMRMKEDLINQLSDLLKK